MKSLFLAERKLQTLVLSFYHSITLCHALPFPLQTLNFRVSSSLLGTLFCQVLRAVTASSRGESEVINATSYREPWESKQKKRNENHLFLWGFCLSYSLVLGRQASAHHREVSSHQSFWMMAWIPQGSLFLTS